MRKFFIILLFVLALPVSVLARDASWAQPLAVSGAPNLNRVSDGLYRSAQPTADGFKAMERQLHVVTDLDLRLGHSDMEFLKGTQITSARAPMSTFMSRDDVINAVRLIVAAQKKGPVLVHCQRGADRTGVVIAMYRVLVQGWDKGRAIAEMEQGGFAYDPFQINLPFLIRGTDLAAAKAALAKGL